VAAPWSGVVLVPAMLAASDQSTPAETVFRLQRGFLFFFFSSAVSKQRSSLEKKQQCTVPSASDSEVQLVLRVCVLASVLLGLPSTGTTSTRPSSCSSGRQHLAGRGLVPSTCRTGRPTSGSGCATGEDGRDTPVKSPQQFPLLVVHALCRMKMSMHEDEHMLGSRRATW
jgi:hypothetical protein